MPIDESWPMLVEAWESVMRSCLLIHHCRNRERNSHTSVVEYWCCLLPVPAARASGLWSSASSTSLWAHKLQALTCRMLLGKRHRFFREAVCRTARPRFGPRVLVTLHQDGTAHLPYRSGVPPSCDGVPRHAAEAEKQHGERSEQDGADDVSSASACAYGLKNRRTACASFSLRFARTRI